MLIGLRVISIGSRLHVRLIILFSVVAIIPSVLVAIFSILVINFGIEQWFNKNVSTAIEESLSVANAYIEEHQQIISSDAISIATDINRGGPLLLRESFALNRIISTQTAMRGLSEIVIIDNSKRILAQAGLTFSMESTINKIPQWAFEKARSGEVAVMINSDEYVHALIKLDNSLIDFYLYIGRNVDPKVIDYLKRINNAVSEYKQLESTRSEMEITFSTIFVMITLLVLLVAIWIGLVISGQISLPITRLVDATELIRSGNLNVRVVEDKAINELGILSSAFNRMIDKLETQRNELIETNLKLDERRRFSDAVLIGVSSGVIRLNCLGLIEMSNQHAAEYLSIDLENMIGISLIDSIPELKTLFNSINKHPEKSVQGEVKITINLRLRSFLVRIVAEQDEKKVTGFIITIDDITDLISAQNKAAWSDIARRIAHEIKNPLTPIQLSAEQLKRKYLEYIKTDPETFLKCTNTIINQVHDIGKMIDEFSNFARMPIAVMKQDDLIQVIDQAIFLSTTSYPQITFESNFQKTKIKIFCDIRQISQAVSNLLKNSIEAVQEREGEDLPNGKIIVNVEQNSKCTIISINDNGSGLPVEQKDHLTEPYITTRINGTGLGLAIVRKIMEDHNGELLLENNKDGGARVSMIFYTKKIKPHINVIRTVNT
jgi:two-component system nitrogen regulation sensor histidine kinase NtrY